MLSDQFSFSLDDHRKSWCWMCSLRTKISCVVVEVLSWFSWKWAHVGSRFRIANTLVFLTEWLEIFVLFVWMSLAAAKASLRNLSISFFPRGLSRYQGIRYSFQDHWPILHLPSTAYGFHLEPSSQIALSLVLSVLGFLLLSKISQFRLRLCL